MKKSLVITIDSEHEAPIENPDEYDNLISELKKISLLFGISNINVSEHFDDYNLTIDRASIVKGEVLYCDDSDYKHIPGFGELPLTKLR